MAAPPQRQRAALLALCLLASACGAAAQCSAGYFRMDMVASTSATDSLTRCLASLRVNLYSDCKVSLTPLNAGDNYVPAIWTGLLSKTYAKFVECPQVEGAKVTPASSSAASVKAAIVKAVEGHVYGFTGAGAGLAAKNPTTLNAATPVVYASGSVTVNRASGVVLQYAVTESTLGSPFQVDNNLAVTTLCSQLPANSCMDDSLPDGIANACNTGRYGIQLTPYLKICALCPAGSYSDEGKGCTSCDAGTTSDLGSTACSNNCGPGFFSPGGSSDCLPCAAATYSDGPANAICTTCPDDSYAWIPGRQNCMRCVRGLPVICVGEDCGPDPPSPGSHIVTVGRLASCGLSGQYEVRAHTKCATWSQASPTTRVQFALVVAGDCSIDVMPIADPTCADPTSASGFSYGNITMRAYYADATTIRSLLPTDANGGAMLSIEPAAGPTSLSWTFWAASGEPADYNGAQITGGTTCTTLTPAVTAGQVVGKPTTVIDSCPVRSYSVPNAYCYPCPPGSTCPGAQGSNLGPRVACADGTYNPLYGGTPCINCPLGVTSYSGAARCDIPAIDKDCYLASYDGVGMQYDPVSQTCAMCKPGTVRDDTLKACVDCPAGYFSGAGAAECTMCPAGQYNPTPGLADQSLQSGIAGQNCLLCPRGSLALSGSQAAATATYGDVVPGATFCDTCPAGFIQDTTDPLKPCVSCASTDPVIGPFTYRTGDATPENNECVIVPSGYALKDPATGVAANTEIQLCLPGTISTWSADGLTRTPADPYACIGCADLTPQANFTHMYAPHAGMISCIPCPAGTVPLTTGPPGASYTDVCVPCPDGYYRDAYTKSATCLKCGAGKEMGQTQGRDCTLCRPGLYMTSAMAAANKTFCVPCPKNYYKGSFGATQCDACTRGYGTQDTGNIDCYPCPVGYFSLAGGDCRPAPVGTFINTTAAFYFTACPEGTWNDEAGQDNCNSCAPGKFSNTIGSTECKTCPAGTYSVSQATSCIDCRAGYAAPAGSDRCHPCKPGTYSSLPRWATCKMCPKGYQCPTAAMTRAAPCPRGTYSNKDGNKLCTPCPINTISTGGGSASNPQPVLMCSRCPVGTNTRGLPGQSKCMPLRPQVRRRLAAEGGGT